MDSPKEANTVPFYERSATQRLSIRASKRRARSSSGLSPLARHLLRTLHEQKRAALAERRARRWDLYSVINQEPEPPTAIVVEGEDEEEDDEEEDQLVPNSVPTIVPEATAVPSEEPSLYTTTPETLGNSGKKMVLIKIRTVKKHVYRVVTRIFERKTNKRQVASSGTDEWVLKSLKSYKRYPCTEL